MIFLEIREAGIIEEEYRSGVNMFLDRFSSQQTVTELNTCIKAWLPLN